jgi:hypothetical protein
VRWLEREPELDLALHRGLRWAEQYSRRWTDVNLELSAPLPRGPGAHSPAGGPPSSDPSHPTHYKRAPLVE